MFLEQEINFDNIDCESSLDSQISFIKNRLNTFKNPYVGNKRKLIPVLIKLIDKYDIKYDTFLDLFCGSAYVSMAIKLLDKKIITNDILTSSYINALAFVKNTGIELNETEKIYLLNNKNSKYSLETILNRHSDKFTDNEINNIGNYYENVKNLFASSIYSNYYIIDYIKYALAIVTIQNYIIDHCFVGGRLNNGQILSNLEHRLKHQRNKKSGEMLFSKIKIQWKKPLLLNDKNDHECYNLDAISLLQMNDNLKIDLCYIDPPYGGDQSDYLKSYCFFEECIREKKYEDIKKENGFNYFTNNKKYEEHFNKLIELTKNIHWIIISYNDLSWGSIDDICNIIKKYRKKVTVEEFPYNYNYRDQNRNTKDTKEYVIISEN